ncbi:MAG: hypothetical protein HF981_13010 [Desulfobacteraceae bacterium]|nr:hypothetical protein [Desulfobacteraceae bacterium]MBC2751301.1 hypothetical protein [Desulfobacteraceae bacterium]
MLRHTRFLLIVALLLAVSGMTHAASTTPKVPATGIGVSSGAAPSSTAPKAPAQRNPAIEKTTAPPPAALPKATALSIRRIYAESNFLRVVIGSSTGAPLTPAVFNGMHLKLSAPVHPINTDLRLTDLLKHKHTRTRANEVDFFTGVPFNRTGRVSATLYAGAWHTDKSMHVTVVGQPKKLEARPQPPAAMGSTTTAAPTSRMATTMTPVNGLAPAESKRPAATVRARRMADGATHPMTAFMDSGIRFIRPTESSHVLPGETLRVQYQFTRVASEGDIIFELVDGANIVLRTTRPYVPPASGEPDGETVTFVWDLPDDLETGQNYFILATRETAFGMSSSFSIGETTGRKLVPAPREVDPIQVQTPRTRGLADPLVVRSFETDITWTMPGDMSLFSCSNRVNLYAVRQADGQESRIRTNVDCDDGDNTIRWQPDAGMTPGRYRIRVVAEDGCQGESGIFRIDACDYAIESVAINGAGSLEAGIDVREHSTVSGTFDVRVRWNGIPVPANLPPGTSWDNRLTVLSALTGANITHPAEGASFTYRDRPADDGILLVRVPFSFPRDDIPTMRRGRHLPLEFRLQPFGASIDSDPTNNTFNGELRVLGATDNDLRIGIYPSDFNLTRRSRAAWSAPVWHCTFTQEVNLTNLAVTDAGGPAGTLTTVPCRWEMQYRNDGSGDFRTFESGSFTMENVLGGAWVAKNIEGHFQVNPDITDRTYRLMVIADPDQTLLDPNRSNNRATVPFRLPD